MDSFLRQGWRKKDHHHGIGHSSRQAAGRELQTSQIWSQLGSDLDGEAADDWYGYSVSLSSDGTVLAVGGRLNDAGGVNKGHVRVFKYASNTWTQLGSDIDGEANHNTSGHSVSLSSDGTVLAIGAPGNTSNAGHVRVYVYNIATNTWTQRGSDMDGEAANDTSGSSVSLSSDGNVVAIGAPCRNSGLPGQVRVYEYNGSAWVRRSTVDIDGEANSDEFGYSVSLSDNGNILAVGAFRNDGNSGSTTDNRGHVRVFSYASNSWTQIGSDIDGEAAGDNFGVSVSLSANGYVLAVGAYGSNSFTGHVRIYDFEIANNAWVQRGGNINGRIAWGWTGVSVSLSSDGNAVAVGARGDLEFVYKYVSSAWTQVGCGIDEEVAGDEAGYSVSLSSDGSLLAVGAPYNDGPGMNNRGHVRVYQLIAGTCATPTAQPTTAIPTFQPTTSQPSTLQPTSQPSVQPTAKPTLQPTSQPTTALPSIQPATSQPSTLPPTPQPTAQPTFEPTFQPTSQPTTALPTLLPTSTPQIWSQLGSDIDGEAVGDLSGSSVSLSSDGTVLAVGSPLNDGDVVGLDRGHVRVYSHSNGAWTQLGSDINGEATGDRSGNSVSLSSDGSVVAIGASFNDPPGKIDAGHVRVYNYVGGTWTQRGGDIDGIYAGMWFGNSVSLSSDGSILAVGAYRFDNGYVFVYQYDSGVGWTQRGSTIVGKSWGAQAGASVALSSDGSVVAIGQPNTDSGSGVSRTGLVRVYKYVSGAWAQQGGDIDGEAANDYSGWAVSLSSDGSVVAVGAMLNDGNGGDSGHVRVYQYVSGSWIQRGSDIDGKSYGVSSGSAVSLSSNGSMLAIGAYAGAGHVRVYQYGNGAWTQVGCDVNGEFSADQSGLAVSLSGNGSVFAVGAPYNDGPGMNNVGHVRVYQLISGSGTCPLLTTSLPTFRPTTSLPTVQPTTAQPSTPPPTSQPSTQPTFEPTFQPTAAGIRTSLQLSFSPTKSPVFVTLPFLGACPAQVNEFVSVHHEPGDRVSNGAIVFQCKEWPLSLFCSQRAFNPDLDSKTDEHWKRAWEVVGHCSGAIANPLDGCPDAWTSGNTEKYKENDRVSVIKSNFPLAQAIYKCKAWPYSWHCGQHSPLEYNGGQLGWEYVGVCAGTIGPTASPTFASGTVIIAGCPAEYDSLASRNYKAGDQVAMAKVVYQCREFPYSGYCNQKGFAPGEQYDYMAWTLLGPCDGTLAPTSAPTTYSGSAPCTYVKVTTATTPTSTPVVTAVDTWSASILYEAGDQVRIGAKKFQCKPWPFYFWCRVSAYAPTLSETGLWTEAWSLAGACPA
jgi:hypothetical protein